MSMVEGAAVKTAGGLPVGATGGGQCGGIRRDNDGSEGQENDSLSRRTCQRRWTGCHIALLSTRQSNN